MLTQSWIVIDKEPVEELPLAASWSFIAPSAPPLEVDERPKFFDNWPSFGVEDKLKGEEWMDGLPAKLQVLIILSSGDKSVRKCNDVWVYVRNQRCS